YFSKFYYFMLFSFAKIKKDSRVLGTLKGFPTLCKKRWGYSHLFCIRDSQEYGEFTLSARKFLVKY
ncbi:hypothetical protein, partial [Bacillus mycoides]|uniref:hypothetical protein n=1 Tax=Bacillus mycoides TaxID=1405 RepID=UPI001A95485F